MSSGQKGVMLCERPGPSQVDTSPGQKPFLPSSNPSGMEPIGLVPSHKTFPPSLAPKPENINLKTIAAVRQLEQENREAALREEERRMADAAKAANVTAFGTQLRAAILAGEDLGFWTAKKKAETVRQSLEASKARSAAATTTSPARQAAEAAKAEAAGAGAARADMTSFVDDLVKEATGVLGKQPAAAVPPAAATRSDGTADASTSGGAVAAAGTPRAGSAGGQRGRSGTPAGGKAGAAAKPAWALTADEVSRLEDAEEEELLRFADDLDFDSFMAALDDAELQESFKALGSGEGDGKGAAAPVDEKAAALRRNLVKAMNHAAMKRVAAAAAAGRKPAGGRGDDGDAASVAGISEGGASRATAASRLRSEAAAAKRSALGDGAAGGGGGWEGSTRGADDVARMERAKASAAEAYDFLRENPELRAVHSPASVRAMIGKTEGTAAATS